VTRGSPAHMGVSPGQEVNHDDPYQASRQGQAVAAAEDSRWTRRMFSTAAGATQKKKLKRGRSNASEKQPAFRSARYQSSDPNIEPSVATTTPARGRATTPPTCPCSLPSRHG
jgi:hypothetical protein